MSDGVTWKSLAMKSFSFITHRGNDTYQIHSEIMSWRRWSRRRLNSTGTLYGVYHARPLLGSSLSKYPRSLFNFRKEYFSSFWLHPRDQHPSTSWLVDICRTGTCPTTRRRFPHKQCTALWLSLLCLPASGHLPSSAYHTFVAKPRSVTRVTIQWFWNDLLRVKICLYK